MSTGTGIAGSLGGSAAEGSISAIALSAGASGTGYNFSEPGLTSISDFDQHLLGFNTSGQSIFRQSCLGRRGRAGGDVNLQGKHGSDQRGHRRLHRDL